MVMVMVMVMTAAVIVEAVARIAIVVIGVWLIVRIRWIAIVVGIVPTIVISMVPAPMRLLHHRTVRGSAYAGRRDRRSPGGQCPKGYCHPTDRGTEQTLRIHR